MTMAENKDQEKANGEETIEDGSKKYVMKVVSSVNPLPLIQNMCAVSTFRVDKEQIIPPNLTMKTLGMVVVLSYCTLFLCTLNFPTRITGTMMSVVNTVNEIPGIVVLIQYVTGAISSSFLVDGTNINVLNSFAELDNMLCVDVKKDFYKKSHYETVNYLIVLLVSHAVICIAAFVTAETYSMSEFTDLPLYFYQKFQILIFCKMILMLTCRLRLINEYITTFIENAKKKEVTIFTIRSRQVATESKYNFIGRPSEVNTKIHDLAATYDLVGEICSMISEAWNFQIFMTLVSTFIYIVITLWTSLYYYQAPENNFDELIKTALWCFSVISSVALMSFTCERLLLTRNETKVLVNKVIMNYDLPKIMRVQAKAFMELIEAWSLRIYIYDMFSVDITLMLKFISVATTYLIVIIQISHLV